MKKILTIILKYILAFSIAIFLLWWSLRSLTAEQTGQIKDALIRAKHWLFVPVFGLLLLSHWFRALRWQQLVTPMGHHPKVYHLLLGILIGYIGNQLIPRAGEILRCTTISKATKTPSEKLIGTIVAERAFDLACFILITIGTVFMEWEYIASYVKEIIAAIKTGLQGTTGKIWMLAVLIVAAFLIWLFTRKLKTHRIGEFIIKMMKGLWQGLTSIQKVQHKLRFTFFTIMIWICYAAATYIGCIALQETAHLSLSTAITMLVFGTFGIIIAPGGLGAYPVAIQKTLVLYSVSEVIGLASGWLLWIAQFIFVIIFGALAYIAVNFINKKQDEESIVHP